MLNNIDAAPQLKINNKSQKPTILGHHGYSTARATHSITEGNYYFEVKILELPTASEDPVKLGQDDSCCRIGFATDRHVLETPVGYGHYSFGIRSKRSTIFHNGKGLHYVDGDPIGPKNSQKIPKNKKGQTFSNFTKNDIIGCRLKLPKINSKLTSTEQTKQRLEHSIKGKKYKVHGTNENVAGNLSNKRRRGKNANNKNYEEELYKKIANSNSITSLSSQNNLKSQDDGVLITFKKFFYFESPDLEMFNHNHGSGSGNGDKKQNTTGWSKFIPKEHPCEIEFYKNGKPLGTAFNNKDGIFPIGEYFPAISLYRSCKVEVNFGPNFEGLGGEEMENTTIQPLCKRVNETVVESAISDLLFKVEDDLNYKRKKMLEMRD